MNANQIIYRMYHEDSVQVDNFNKIGFEMGMVREEYETFPGALTHFDTGKAYCYLLSNGIYFPISEESMGSIADKFAKLREMRDSIKRENRCKREQELEEKIKMLQKELGELRKCTR